MLSCSVVSDSLWPYGLTVHGVLQARILEWVAVPFSSGPSRPRSWTGVSCIAGRFFTSWAIREAQVFLLGESHGPEEPGRLQSVGSQELDATERLSTAQHYVRVNCYCKKPIGPDFKFPMSHFLKIPHDLLRAVVLCLIQQSSENQEAIKMSSEQA